MKESYTEYIRSIDAHSPVSSEFRIRTLSGALLSLTTLLLTLYLISSEYGYNLAPTFLDHVRVMPQSPDGLEVEFDLTFPHIPCAIMATDASDPTGQSQSFHIDRRHRVWKHRIDADGNLIGRKSRFELGGTLTKEDQLDSLKKAKHRHGEEKKKEKEKKGKHHPGKKDHKKDHKKDREKDHDDPNPNHDDDEIDDDHHDDDDHDDHDDHMIDDDAEIDDDAHFLDDDIAEERRLSKHPRKEEDMEEADDEKACGSCYGAGEEGECCNTCDDVKRLYHRKQWHIPDITKISQCKHVTRSSEEEGEGCNVHGIVALSTGGGNLHFAPDRQWEKEGDPKSGMNTFGGFLDLSSVLDMFNEAFEQFNVSHTVNKLSFGPYMDPRVRSSLNLTSQLDGAVRAVADGYGMFQYYLQVVPTVFRFLNGTVVETFQYSVTEHTRHVEPGSNRGLPGVFFFYEVSALHVEFEEYRRGWTHFFTGVCAAVGGAFTVMGMLDRGLFEWKNGGKGADLVR